jgi:hypothetical protein
VHVIVCFTFLGIGLAGGVCGKGLQAQELHCAMHAGEPRAIPRFFFNPSGPRKNKRHEKQPWLTGGSKQQATVTFWPTADCFPLVGHFPGNSNLL